MQPTETTMTFVSGKDDIAIAASIANHLGKPVVIERPDGTKHYVIPLDTAQFDTVAVDGGRIVGDVVGEPHKPRGPHNDEDEIGFGEPYDSPGG